MLRRISSKFVLLSVLGVALPAAAIAQTVTYSPPGSAPGAPKNPTVPTTVTEDITTAGNCGPNGGTSTTTTFPTTEHVLLPFGVQGASTNGLGGIFWPYFQLPTSLLPGNALVVVNGTSQASGSTYSPPSITNPISIPGETGTYTGTYSASVSGVTLNEQWTGTYDVVVTSNDLTQDFTYTFVSSYNILSGTQSFSWQWAGTQVSPEVLYVGGPCVGTTNVNEQGSTTINWLSNPISSSYTVTLSGLAPVQPSPTALAAPPNTLAITATVTDSNENVVPGVDVHLVLSAVNSSGGHQHGDDMSQLRTGTFPGFANTTYDVTTDATGSAATTFYAPSVSGTVLITATCESVTCTQAGPNSINLMVAGLVSLQSPALDFILVGNIAPHIDSHYLTPQAILKAKQLAHLWHTLYPDIPRLAFNDASLEWGGTFDLDSDWVGPHAEHRAGVVIDVRANGDITTAIPQAYYGVFNQYVKQLGGNTLFEGDHFHVRLLGVGQ
jgi:hypothetical protein